METLPYLLVEPSPAGFHLHLGGSSIANGELWLAPFLPASTTPGILARRWSSQASFSLYRLLDKESLADRPEPVSRQTFFQDCEQLLDALNALTRRSAEAVYRLGGKPYIGVYTTKSTRYGFYSLEGW